MSYSCTDFTDDVLNKLSVVGLINPDDVPDDDPEFQAQLTVGAIDTLMGRVQSLTDLLRLASVPGGVGEHEFSRPGGWRETALRAIASDTPLLRLFFVSADDENGENVDLLTRAPDEETAVKQWRKFFKDGDLPENPQWVGIVPTAGGEGAIPWSDINLLGKSAGV